jgi:hypothetical protein
MAQNSERSAKRGKGKKAGKRRRGPGRPFEPGVSGNPGGRPKNHGAMRERFREHTEEALTALLGVIRGQWSSAADRRAAAVNILDRGWGKPEIALTGKDGDPLNVGPKREDDLIAVLTRLADRGTDKGS